MKLLVAALACLLLAQVVSAGLFGWGLNSYRDASSNYYELMTNCEQEGGECIGVDFATGIIGGGRKNDANSGKGGENEGAPQHGRPGKRGQGRRRIKGRAVARRPAAASESRQPMDPQEIFDYLYSECRSWEFDFGCHRKGNICCY